MEIRGFLFWFAFPQKRLFLHKCKLSSFFCSMLQDRLLLPSLWTNREARLEVRKQSQPWFFCAEFLNFTGRHCVLAPITWYTHASSKANSSELAKCTQACYLVSAYVSLMEVPLPESLNETKK